MDYLCVKDFLTDVRMRGMGKLKDKKCKENICCAMICVLIALLCFLPVIRDVVTGQYPHLYGIGLSYDIPLDEERMKPLERVTSGMEVRQTFICDQSNVIDVQLFGVPGTGNGTGTLQVKMYQDESSELIDEWELSAYEFDNADGIKLSVKNPLLQDQLRWKWCSVVITLKDAGEEDELPLYFLPGDVCPGGSLTVNGVPVEGDLVMKITGYTESTDLEFTKVMLCLYLAVFLEWLFYLAYRRKRK